MSLLITLIFSSVVFANEKSYIDVHSHFVCVQKRNAEPSEDECFVNKKLRESFKFKLYVKSVGVTPEEFRQRGRDAVGDRISNLVAESKFIKSVVLLALDGWVNLDGRFDWSKTEVYIPTQVVLEQTKRHNNLLLGASINPNRLDAISRLEQAKKDGAVLIKWIPSIMGIDVASDRLKPFYQKLIQLNLPLLIHTGDERTFSSAQDDLADPSKIELPLKMGVRVIAAHIASSGERDGVKNFETLLALMDKYPNLYTDISATTQINRKGVLPEVLRRERYTDRMLYGSDWPLQFFPLVWPMWYLGSIPYSEIRNIGSVSNQWDRDVMIKKALGVPEAVFTRVEDFLFRTKDASYDGKIE